MIQISDSVRKKILSRIATAHNAFVSIGDYADEKGLKVIMAQADANSERLLGVLRYLEAMGGGYYRGVRKNGGKNVAHRLPNDMYDYRGYIIKKWDNNYLNDPEIRGFQYNVYRSMSDYKKSSSLDIVDTLREAKQFIDGMVERA